VVDGVFDGVRVLEVATWTFVPAAAALLADFGADVIKVEHPVTGDPQRGLSAGGLIPGVGGVSLTTQQTNRGKRSIGLDLSSDEGRRVLYRLAETADVFMTNFLPDVRRKLSVDLEDIRRANPTVIYVRADALGRKGPEEGRPGYDHGVYWARSGIGHAVSGSRSGRPANPRPALGDKTGSLSVAFGVASALFKRARTGRPSVVDVSLLGTALFVNSSDIVYSKRIGRDFSREPLPGPHYRTADDRWISLEMPNPERWFADVCRDLGRDDLVSDERFATPEARAVHREAFHAEIETTIAAATLPEWRSRLARSNVACEPMQNLMEVLEDPQVAANGYLTEIEHPAGESITLVRAPVQFDEELPELRCAPQAGADTDDILREMGYTRTDVDHFRRLGVIPAAVPLV